MRLYYLVKSWRIINTNGESLLQNGELLSSGVRGVGSNEDMVVEPRLEGREPPRPNMANGNTTRVFTTPSRLCFFGFGSSAHVMMNPC